MGNFKLHWHRLLDSKSIKIDGLHICTQKDAMPKSVRSSLFKGTHEAHERYLVTKYLNSDDRVLEIGAATGLVSLICAKQCGVENVFSYEANPIMESLIVKNFELNQWVPNLTMKAITLDGADVEFFATENVYSSSLIDRSQEVAGKKITVASDPINSVIGDIKPTTLVMDVEGAEIEILHAADLRNIDKMIIEFHPHINGQDVVDMAEEKLTKQGFEILESAHKTVFFQRNIA